MVESTQMPLRALADGRSTVRYLAALWVAPAIALTLRCGPGLTAVASYFVVAAYSLLGRRQAIVGLFLMFLFTNINHGLGAPIGGAAVLRWMILLASAYAILSRGKAPSPSSRADGLLVATGGLVLMIIVHSLAISPIPDISVLKALSFGIAVLCLLAGWSWMGVEERRATEQMIVGGLMAMAAVSIPLLALPMGFMRTRVGFQGVVAHPQTFGPVMACLGAFLASRWLTSRRSSTLAVAMLGLCLLWMYLARARIGVFAFVGGVGIASCLYPLQTIMSRYSRSARPLLSRLMTAGFMGLVVAVIFGPALYEKGIEFVTKGSKSADTLTDVALSSRGFLIERMMANVRAFPTTGIGFGIPSNPELRHAVARDPIFGLAVSAPVEKGVMPVALLEELGIPLAAIVFIWIGWLGRRAANGGFVPLTVFLTAMLTNVAEATFFSPGGTGILMLILVTWSATAPVEVNARLAVHKPTAYDCAMKPEHPWAAA